MSFDRSPKIWTDDMMDGYPLSPPPEMGPPWSVQQSFNEMPPSLNDPPGYSSASKDDATGGGPRVVTAVIGVMILLGIIVMAVVAITLASGSSSNVKTTWSDEQPDITEKDESTKKETTEETTEEDTRSTTTELPTTRAKKDTWAGLICTIGTKLSAPEALPQDSLCIYLFYDSVYKEGPAQFDPGHLPPALSILLGHLSRYGYTQLGIGFAYKYIQHLKSELSANDYATPTVLKHFFDKKICHFGILDTPTDSLDKSTLEEMLESLKLIDGFVRSKGAWPKTCHTVVAVPTPDTGLEDVYLEVFPKIFTPSVVVILSHYVEGDNTFQDCRVVPPTMLTRPTSLTMNSAYKFDLNSAAESIEKLIARGMDATWALSVTMKGRWTKLKAGEPVDFLSECEHDPSAESFGRYADKCGDPSFSYKNDSKSQVVGALYYNKMDGRILSFDNNTNLVLKLCRLRAQHLTFAYGIAAYDVDYDDYSEVCESMSVHFDFTNVFTLALVEDYMRGGGPRVVTAVIGVMILLGIIVMAVVAITLASGSSSNVKTTWSDEQPDITEKNVRGGSAMTVIVPEFRVPSTPPPLTAKSITQASTKKETTEETTEEDTRSTTTELPTTPAKKDTWAGLICTIGTKLSAPEALPQDSLCNYLFYDSVYKEGPAQFDPGHLPPGLSILLGRFSAHNYTQLGIGFAYKYTQHLKSELSTNDSDTPAVLEHFFHENICHFGVLDAPTEGLEKSSLEEMLESLKLIDGFVRSKGAWSKTCHTVAAVPTPDTGLEDVYLEIFP
ncbi:hypothetical protein MTO96_017707 [Rhipicephalus appendiculatus]